MPSLKTEPLHLQLYSRTVLSRSRREDCFHLVVVIVTLQTLDQRSSICRWSIACGPLGTRLLWGHDIRMHSVMRNALACTSIFWLCGNDARTCNDCTLTRKALYTNFPMYITELLCLNIKKPPFQFCFSHVATSNLVQFKSTSCAKGGSGP